MSKGIRRGYDGTNDSCWDRPRNHSRVARMLRLGSKNDRPRQPRILRLRSLYSIELGHQTQPSGKNEKNTQFYQVISNRGSVTSKFYKVG